MIALIPARNEGPRVAAVVRGALEHVDSVLVVVNGCSDDTAAQAQAAGARVIESEPGYARALLAGYRALRGQPLVQLDADGQHDPADLPILLGARPADIVIGSRFLDVRGYPVPRRRRLAISALGVVTSALIGQRIHDVTSGFMRLSPRATERFADDFPAEIADANVLVRAARSGLSIAEVGVSMKARQGGESMHQGLAAVAYAGRMSVELARERWRSPRHADQDR